LKDGHGRVRRKIDTIKAGVSGGESGGSSDSSDLEDETRNGQRFEVVD